jgi:hypothetical protein
VTSDPTSLLPAALYGGRGAVLSDCGQYRYLLWRDIGPGDTVCFCMLNPSVADALKDDPTIRKCIGFATRWGFGRLEVVNLFAYRSTDPEGLSSTDAPRSEPGAPKRNFAELRDAFERATWIVAAWGAHKTHFTDSYGMLESLKQTWPKKLRVLAFNSDCSPKHPLYVPYSQQPVSVVQ